MEAQNKLINQIYTAAILVIGCLVAMASTLFIF